MVTLSISIAGSVQAQKMGTSVEKQTNEHPQLTLQQELVGKPFPNEP